MADDKVVLLLRIRLTDGKRCYARPAVARNGKSISLEAFVNKKIERHPEGVYTLRYREQGRPTYRQVGTDYDAAVTARLRLELELRASSPSTRTGRKISAAQPVEPPAADPASISNPPISIPRTMRVHTPLTALRDSFIEKYAHGSDDTIYAYTYVGTEFVKLMVSRGKSTPADLEEIDAIAFDRRLESLGNSKTTRASRYGYLRCFLRHCGLNPSRIDDKDESSGVVTAAVHKKLKAKPKLAVENYDDTDLLRLYAASSERHCLIWRTFRMLGLRDEELAYSLWTNINWRQKVWQVRFKSGGTFPWNLNLEWKPKDAEERDIPIPDVLYKELRAWREKNLNTHLVFPTSGGQADIKLLKALKSDWREAGLNCQHCRGCLGPKKECNKAKLKTFRATYLTTMLQHIDLRSVQALAGHSDIATTQKYLAPASREVLQNAANAAFGSFE